MATGVYNGFKGDLRDKVGQLQELLIRDGYMKPPTKCYQCGQTKGRIVYHLEDYRAVTSEDTPMCFMCHMVLHCTRSGTFEYRSEYHKMIYEKYVQACKDGYCKLLYNPQPLFDALKNQSFEQEFGI